MGVIVTDQYLTDLVQKNRITKYIGHPYFCPYCLHGAIEATKLEAFENMVYQWVRCDKCETEWQDVYELVGVEKVEIP